MKLIIAGSRTLNEYDVVEMIDPLLEFFNIDKKKIKEIVSGGADGVDKAAEYYQERNDEFDFIEVKANWPKYGKKAGVLRNAEMADYADALLLIWDGESKGSKNMKKEMLTRGKPVYEVTLKTHAQTR